MSIQNNMLAKNANRQFNVNIKKNTKLSEKLSSGYRINRAADDAAGLAISEKMRRQIRGLNQSGENIKDGIGYVQTAEGALNEVHEILQRINVLAVKAANGTNNVEDRAYINEEIQALKAEMARIFSTTTFNEQRIWEPEEYAPVVGHTQKQAVTFNGSYSQNEDVTNANCGVAA
ncbi:MAG: flagellar hook protein, partial [Lachnospiraceae bacterium]|nr:flagellar hook protein [Lachnospiraceae bacterium]